MRSDRYRIYFLYILLLLMNVSVFAGTTGKIAGKIVDKETGEALPGVNVIVKGTTMGAATDFDGFYTILNVPPGTHTLVASMVGYHSVTVEDVRVRIDQTSPVDITLVPEAVEITDIVVVAERNELKKDVSTSVVAVQSAEIETLPVTSVAEVVTLQAGVEDGMAIRGGTADQNLLMVDGITQRDPRDNSPISSVALTSIQEVNVEKGGFNAEYGQVQSGVINIVQKEGDISDYTFAIQGKYSPASPKYFGMSVFDANSMWNRPFLDDAVAWDGTQHGTWDFYTQRQYPYFQGWNSISKALLSDNDPSNDLSPAACQRVWKYLHRRTPKTDQPDFNIDASFGGPVPVIGSKLGNLRFFTSFVSQREMLLIPLSRDDYREYNWSMKVNSDITDQVKLMLSASTGKYNTVGVNFEEAYLNNPTNFGILDGIAPWGPTMYLRSPLSIAQMLSDSRDSKIYSNSWYSAAEVSHFTLSGKVTGFITSSTYYEASLEHVNRKYKTGPVAARNTLSDFELLSGINVDEAPFGFDSRGSYGIYQSVYGDMFLGGHSGEMFDSTVSKSYKAKFDLTSQINNTNLVKFGIEFTTFNLNLNYGYQTIAYGSNKVKEEWNPYQLGVYLQDKIEMYGFIANLGLRMDVSNPNTEWANLDAFNKAFFSADYKPGSTYSEKKANVDVSFSPRIGISHPITENSKLYFNYGHFKQLPAYQEMFRIGRGVTGSMANFGNPNLIQARTIAYELGYDHVLLDSYLLQIQAFYRDISDVQGYTFVNSSVKNIGYNLANNSNYADTRGVEVTFKKTGGDWIRGFLTFTYQLSTTGTFSSGRLDDDPVQQRQNEQNTAALYQTRPVPQPRSRGSITFISPKDYGPAYGGLQPLGNWAVNILADWQGGQWINYNPRQVKEFNNIPNVQVDDNFNVNLKVNKTFDLNFVDLMLFVEFKNLLNSKTLSGASFMDIYDQQDYLNSLHLPESSAYENIPGKDRVGDYRDDNVKFQPIEAVSNIASVGSDPLTSSYASRINAGAIFYDRSNKKYYEYTNSKWSEVSSGRMNKILDDKAYIDMPNNTSFNFLNPRQVFFGINLSFKL